MGISLYSKQYKETIVGTLLDLTDTNASNVLAMNWNEDDTADRTLGILVSGANRTLTLTGNPSIGTVTIAPAAVGFTVAGGTTSKTLTVDSSGTLGTAAYTAATAYAPAAGSSNIVTVGSISAGGWHGTTIDVDHGGTGATTLTSNTLLKGNGTGVMAFSGITDDGTDVAIPRGTTIGTVAAGKNLTVNATEGTELITAPMVSGGWTLETDTGGWSIADGTLTKTSNATLTRTATAVTGMTSAPTAGVTYKVVIVCSAVSGTLTYTLGGASGTTITATTVTDYITATDTTKIIFSGANTVTATITSVSVKALTDATGDVTIRGNVITANQILASPLYNPSYPTYSFSDDSDTGFSRSASNTIRVLTGGTSPLKIDSGQLLLASGVSLGWNDDIYLYRDAANTPALRNSTTQQKFNIYNTYTSSSSYERLALTGVIGASLNITAETAGAEGADNLNLILAAVGTGQLMNTAANITAGTHPVNAGYITRQVYAGTVTEADFVGAGTTADYTICTLPAKTRIVAIYADTTAAYTGGGSNAATLTVGNTAGGSQYLASHNVFAGAITVGLADADMGTEMTRAAKIQDAGVVTWAATTTVQCRITTTNGTPTGLTAGSTTFYIVTERL